MGSEALFKDGILQFAACVPIAAFLTVRHLRGAPKGVVWALAAAVVSGVVLRAVIAQPVQMEGVYASIRIFPVAKAVAYGPMLALLSRHGLSVFLTDVIFATNFVLAALSPLVLFMHAKMVLKDHWSAVAAATLVAFLPGHIRFSMSDASQVLSFISSSLTFVLLYTALTDPSAVVRTLSTIALPALSLAAYLSRDENLVFFPIDAAAIVIASRISRVPFRRAAILFALSLGAAILSLMIRKIERPHFEIINLFTAFPKAVILFLNPRQNTLINPTITPPAYPLLAAVGLLALWQRGERARVSLLLSWFGVFCAVSALAVAATPEMQMRYHLQLLPPMVLMAAAAMPVLARTRYLRYVALASVLSAPFLYWKLERDTNFYEMREFRFLTSLRDVVPEGCTVLEFQPQGSFGTEDPSRVKRVAARLKDGQWHPLWTVVDSAQYDPELDEEVLSDEARAILAKPPACLMIYEGITCWSHRPLLDPIAPVCRQLAEIPALMTVRETTFRARGYDVPGMSGRFRDLDGMNENTRGILEGGQVSLRLLRAEDRSVAGAH